MPANWINNHVVPTELESQNEDLHFMEAQTYIYADGILQIWSSALV